MNKKAKTMLILSCVFVTLTAILAFFDAYLSVGTYSVFFSNPENLGEALGYIFALIIFFAYTIILGAAVLIAGAITLPFVITLIKLDGKKWYSLVILIFTIVAMAMAVVFVIMLPVASHMASGSSSSSSSDSSAALSDSANLLLAML